MKKLIRLSCLMIALIATSFFAQEARASHAQGSDLTYVNVGPNQYLVTFTFYRDCSGIDAPTSQSLNFRAPGCSAGGTITMSKNSVTIGAPYCDQIVPICQGSTLPNYEKHVYSALLTLPAQCANWILSTQISARNSSYNLTSQGNLYSEATLNNVAAPTNTSPTFSTEPVPYVCKDQLRTFSINAFDLDGDSINYQLVNALVDFNSPVSYKSGYSGINPFGPDANPSLTLDPVNGSLTFRPTVFRGGAPSAGNDKYVVVVQVNEFRFDSVSGMWIKIGHVRRDILVTVTNCAANQVPDIPTYGVDTLLGISANQITDVQACNTAVVTFRGSDPDLTNRLFLSTEALTQLPTPPGAFPPRVNITGGANPVGTVTWTPDASLAGRTFFFTVTVSDDACPLPGSKTVTLGIRVLKNSYALAASADSIICAGQPTVLNAESLRPTTVDGRPAVLRYEWTPGATLSDSTVKNPIATPLVTTNYIVKVYNTASSACYDVDTVRVVVSSSVPVLDTVVASKDTVCFGETVRLIGSVTNDTSASMPFTYMWTTLTGDTLPDMNDTIIVNPRGTTSYVFHAMSGMGCSVTDTIQIVTGDSITTGLIDNVMASASGICSGEKVTLTGVASTVNPFAGVGPFMYMWTTAAGDTLSMNESIEIIPPAGINRYVFHVMSAGGCFETDTIQVAVADSISAEFTPDYDGSAAPVVVNFNNTSYTDSTISKQEWYVIEVNENNQPHPDSTERLVATTYTASDEFLTTGRYRIRLRNYTLLNGRDTCSVEAIRYINLNELTIPNIFTPNGDQLNDKFVIPGVRKGTKLTVYNRWGGVVKEIENYSESNAWDGKDAADGTYFYMIKDDLGKVHKGWVEITR